MLWCIIWSSEYSYGIHDGGNDGHVDGDGGGGGDAVLNNLST